MSTSLITHEGIAAPMPMSNIDTDMILPARFLKTTTRSGLGSTLFHEIRFDANGAEKCDFILNRAPWRNASFLIALDNFGCGSSREHAPWALQDFGIRCIIASSFADIFAGNCVKNGILCITFGREICDRLLAYASDPSNACMHVDLPCQQLTLSTKEKFKFEIAPEWKRKLIEGLNDITETLRMTAALAAHDAIADYPRPNIPLNIAELAQSPGRKAKLPTVGQSGDAFAVRRSEVRPRDKWSQSGGDR